MLVAGARFAATSSASPTASASASASSAAAPAPSWAPFRGARTSRQSPAPADWYRDAPIYVGNEMPVDAVREWASRQPGFSDLWIDRQHHGWITVGFSSGAEARQAELEREFPGVGVVAVTVELTTVELDALQQRVQAHLNAHFPASTSGLINYGVVGVGLGVLNDERLALLEEAFAGEPICVEGADPADVPAPGPQALPATAGASSPTSSKGRSTEPGLPGTRHRWPSCGGRSRSAASCQRSTSRRRWSSGSGRSTARAARTSALMGSSLTTLASSSSQTS